MNPLPVFVTESASAAIREASAWWGENRPGAGTTIADELARVFLLISLQPGIGARARNVALPDVRRVHIARIHYHLYYRLAPTGERVDVLAFWHTSRGSAPPITGEGPGSGA